MVPYSAFASRLAVLSLAIFLSGVALRADDSSGSTLLPKTDNTAPPYLAVYRWGQGGCTKGYLELYAKWLNRKTIWAEDFMPTEGWDKIEGQDWQLGTWSWWVKQQPGRRLVLSVPLLVGGWDGKGPQSGPEAGVPVSLEEGAKGAYNGHFRTLAEHLVAKGLGDTILRLGWEFNGGWYAWRAQSEEQAVAFAGYFRQIVTTMRSVPGTENLKFVWNPCMVWMNYSMDKAWPGDDYVDYVGLDIYDDSWAKDTYPIPAHASPDQIDALHKKVWNDVILHDNNHGLLLMQDFANRHGHKPLVIPEWGIDSRGGTEDHGGLDNPYFIQQMYNFIYNPGNNVFFSLLFRCVGR